MAQLPKILLTPFEIQRLNPALYRRGMPWGYYLDRSANPPRLGFIRVDVSARRGRWDRVLAKAVQDARAHAQRPGWRELIAAGQFEITIVTTMSQKAERLLASLKALTCKVPVPIHVHAVPELLYLIAPPPEIPSPG